MTANVTVVVNHADNVVYLPTTAVTARGANASVNVEIGTDPTKTTATPITVGLRGDNTIEITTGLKAGDKIVIVRTAVAAGTTAAGGARAGATGAAAGAAGITGGAGGAGGGAGARAGG